MAFHRRSGNRFTALIWPGFVDAITALLMVMIFVLTIFMIVQFVLRETITTQDTQMGQLNAQIQNLADALGLEKRKNTDLSDTLSAAQQKADEQTSLIATLNSQLAAKSSDLSAAKLKITDFEARVAGLLADKASAQKANDQLTAKLDDVQAQRAALQLAVAKARKEVDAQAEAARLAAARAAVASRLVLRGHHSAASGPLDHVLHVEFFLLVRPERVDHEREKCAELVKGDRGVRSGDHRRRTLRSPRATPEPSNTDSFPPANRP